MHANDNVTPNMSHTLHSICIAAIELPPMSKKLSCAATCLTRSTSHQISFMLISNGDRLQSASTDGTSEALVADKLARSSLPSAVLGNASMIEKCAGTWYSAMMSRRARLSVVEVGGRADSVGTTKPTSSV